MHVSPNWQVPATKERRRGSIGMCSVPEIID
jgi:hypothetical protein